MTQQELDAMKGLCDGATALMGDEWEYDEKFLTVFFAKGYINTRQPIAEMRGGTFLMQYSGDTWDKVVPQLHANGRFIAAARTALPQLIAEVRRLQVEHEAPPKPLTLEELRQMDGDPVYVQQGDGDQGWHIVRTSEPLRANVPLGAERVVWIVNDENPDGDGFDTDFINMEYADPAGHFGLHVLGWRAYRRRPNAR